MEKVSDLIRRWLKNAPGKSTFTLDRAQLRSLLAEIDGPEEKPAKSLGLVSKRKKPKPAVAIATDLDVILRVQESNS